MNAKLTSLDYGAEPDQLLLAELPLVIGRNDDCRFSLDDRWVSRRHCQLDQCDGLLIIRDLGSKYGTFVNGRAVCEAPLMPGDMLSIGLSNFVAQYELPPLHAATLSSCESASSAEISSELHLAGPA